MDDEFKKIAEEICDGDQDCVSYLYENCPEMQAKYPSQMDYYLTGKDCLVQYARKFRSEKEKQ